MLKQAYWFIRAIPRVFIFMLNDLFGEPDDFRDKPYGFFINQFGHIVAGVGLFFVVWRLQSDPTDVLTLFVIFGLYTSFELIKQGWRRWDTVLDIYFVMSGAVVSVFFDIEFVFSYWQSLSALGVALAILFFATWYIYYREKG